MSVLVIIDSSTVQDMAKPLPSELSRNIYFSAIFLFPKTERDAKCFILRMNFLPNHVIEGKIEGTGIQGRKRKQLLDDLTRKRRSTTSHSVEN